MGVFKGYSAPLYLRDQPIPEITETIITTSTVDDVGRLSGGETDGWAGE
jgi:hypothetical protein